MSPKIVPVVFKTATLFSILHEHNHTKPVNKLYTMNYTFEQRTQWWCTITRLDDRKIVLCAYNKKDALTVGSKREICWLPLSNQYETLHGVPMYHFERNHTQNCQIVSGGKKVGEIWLIYIVISLLVLVLSFDLLFSFHFNAAQRILYACILFRSTVAANPCGIEWARLMCLKWKEWRKKRRAKWNFYSYWTKSTERSCYHHHISHAQTSLAVASL